MTRVVWKYTVWADSYPVGPEDIAYIVALVNAGSRLIELARLGAAWAAAEAVLPEGWRIYSVHRGHRQDQGQGRAESWSVIAHTPADGYHETAAVHDHEGDLPAALLALEAALRERTA